MAAAYAWADLVICRAGALTLAELCAAGVPAILVPFPHAVDDHQTRNAESMVEPAPRGWCGKPRISSSRLAPLFERSRRSRDAAEAWRRAARTLAKPDAADASPTSPGGGAA